MSVVLLAFVPGVGLAHGTEGEGDGPFNAPAGQPRKAPGPELPLLRTRTSKTYEDETSGDLVARIGSESVNYRAGEAWKPISNDLVPSGTAGYARRNEANDYRVEFPADLSGAPIRVSRGAAWASLKLVGAQGAGTFAGRTAKYPGVLPGVSAEYVVDNDTVKENLIFTSGQTPTVSFDLAVAAGLTPRRTRSGIALVDADGKVRLSFARPFLYDHDGQPVKDSRLSSDLTRTAGGWRLALSIERAWLTQATADGPVTLDPNVNTTVTQDCKIDSVASDAGISWCSDPVMGTGYIDAGHDHVSLLKFDVQGALPAGAEIRQAFAWAYQDYADGPSAQEIGVHRQTTEWTNDASWQSRNGTDGWDDPAGGGDLAAQEEDTTWLDGAGGWKAWTVTDMARGWLHREFENHGLGLRSKTTLNSNWFQFVASESTSSQRPYLEVRYSPPIGIKPFWTFAGKQQLSDRDQLQVNVGSGNLVVQSNDLSVPGAGLDASFGRMYNSIPHGVASDVGNTWKPTGMDAWISPDWQPGGRDTVGYRDETGATYHLKKQPDGSWRTPELKAKLTRNADGAYDLVYDASRLQMRFDTTNANPDPWETRRVMWVEDRNDNRVTFTRNANSTVTKITDTRGREHNLTYSPWGALEHVTDSSGRVHDYDYTSGTQIGAYTDPDGKTMSFDYASNQWAVNDDLAEITDYAGNKTKITYDAQHRVTAITRITNPATGAGDTTTFVYAQEIDDPCDPSDSGAKHVGKTIVTDPRGKSTTYCYDAKLRVTKSKDAGGQVRDTAFDAQSNVEKIESTSSSTGTLGFNASYTFSGDGVLDQISQGAGGGNTLTTSFQYDASANGGRYQPKSTTSPQGNSTLFGYDTKGNLTSTKQAASSGNDSEAILDYGPSGKGEATSSTDPDGNTTTYDYNAHAELVKINPPAGSGIGATEVTYDALSRVKTVKDGKGQTRTYDYDPRDRIKQITFGDGSSTTWTHDGNGAVLSRADAPAAGLLGLTTLLIDAKGRVTKETRPNGKTTEYTYDGVDNLKSLKDDGGTTTYTYGQTNLLASMVEPGVATPATFEYNGDNNRTKATLPNGVIIESPYDPAGRLQKILAKKNTTVLQDLIYDYKKAGPETSLLQKVTDGLPTGADDVTTYGYDGLDRLDTAVTTGSNPASYDYDLTDAGNRTQVQFKDPGAASTTTTTYGYNPGNQLTQVNGSSANLTYDGNGNQTKSPSFGSVAYNARDQITGITPAGSSTVSSLEHAGPGQNDLVSQAGVTLQNDALGLASKTAGTTTTYYHRTPSGEPVSQKAGTARRYFLTDERGSIVGLTDTGGTKTNTYKYDPYGRTLGTPHDTLGYAGGVRSPGGLTHFGARYYDAQTGRWTQRDPINQADDLTDGNAYVYASTDPVNETDASGECPLCPGLAAGARAIGRGASAAWRTAKSVRVKVGYHNHAGGPHNYPHLQVNYWRKGAKGSGWALRTPRSMVDPTPRGW